MAESQIDLKKAQVEPNNFPKPGDSGNTVGIVVPKTNPNANPPSDKPETPQEGGWWHTLSPWVHGGLGAVSFIPGLSVVSGAIDAGIYTAEGDYVEAALSAASMIPGGKIATSVGKGAVKGYKLAKGVLAAEDAAKAAKAAEEAAKAAERAKAAEEAAKAAERAKAAEEAAKAAERAKTAEEAAKAAEARAAAEVKAAKKNGGYVKQNPHPDCGKIVMFSDTITLKGSGLQKDHTPSAAALREAVENRINELEENGKITIISEQRKTIKNLVVNNAETIAIPRDVHAAGDTYKGKNTKVKIDADSKDLNGAARRNTEKISDAMKNKQHGCSKAYAEAAAKILKKDWNKYIDDTIDQVLKGKK